MSLAAYVRWLPRMLKVASCTDLYYARGAQGVLPLRVGSAISQSDLPSLMPFSVAGFGRLQLGVPTLGYFSILLQVVYN